MTIAERIAKLETETAQMDSSKTVCVQDAKALIAQGNLQYAESRVEQAAMYVWGVCYRPANW